MCPGSAGTEVFIFWIYIQVSNQTHKHGEPRTVHATAIFAGMSARQCCLLVFIFRVAIKLHKYAIKQF
jgi:hypothetical protein